MTNISILPLRHWPENCPTAFAAELVRIVDEERSLDRRMGAILDRQRALKRALAITGLPSTMIRNAVGQWTSAVFEAEQRILIDRREAR